MGSECLEKYEVYSYTKLLEAYKIAKYFGIGEFRSENAEFMSDGSFIDETTEVYERFCKYLRCHENCELLNPVDEQNLLREIELMDEGRLRRALRNHPKTNLMSTTPS